jgi:hypothetical protein
MKKRKLIGAIAIALLLVLVFAVVAQAAVPRSVIDAIIKDAQDGTIDGNWSSAEIQATLDFIQNNPVATQYTDIEGVLTDFLGSSQAPGSQGGSLAFTGGEVVYILGAGLGLIGAGMVLRRRHA